MFEFNAVDENYVDHERGIRVIPGGGPGHGTYSAEVVGPNYSFHFTIFRETNRATIVGQDVEINDDYYVKLRVGAYPPRNSFVDEPLRNEIAREIAMLRETQVWKTDLSRVTIL